MPSTGSPKERLQRLFHKNEGSTVAKKDATNSPPPAASSSPNARQSVRKSLSRTSLRDMMHGGTKSRPTSIAQDSSRQVSAAEAAPSYPAQVAAQTAMHRDPAPARTSLDRRVPNLTPTRDSTQVPMRQDREHRLPSLPQQSALSSDLQSFTTKDYSLARPLSEVAAERSAKERTARKLEYRSAQVPTMGNAQPLVPRSDRYSEDVANWNIAQGTNSAPKGAHDLPAPLRVGQGGSGDSQAGSTGSPVVRTTSAESHSLTRKPVYNNLRKSQDATRPMTPENRKTSIDDGNRRVKRSSLDKPLPAAPSDEFMSGLGKGSADQGLGHHTGEFLVKDAKEPVSLKGIVDLSNTEDTTLHETWAPAVTHETVVQNVHHVREERITREIHNHHVFHRILPIVDIEVLPARHFVPIEGGYAEIHEDEVPGRTGQNAQWLIAETVSKLMPKSTGPLIPHQFTARKFEGTDGDYREYMAPEGFPRTETVWVHPPTIETGAMETGQSYPFYIGSPNPADDGLRAKLPRGQVIGSSPMLARQQKQMMGGERKVNGEAPPPVPQHKVFPFEAAESAKLKST